MSKTVTLIFASNNQHKANEINALLPPGVEILTLKEAGIQIDIEEPFKTLEENARVKSGTIHRLHNCNCFAEDSGLEVEFLNGAPGVRSARYAGKNATAEDNINKLMEALGETANRKARFRTVISLYWEEKEYQFEGECEGHIAMAKRGSAGFGYDPVFIPAGASKTFAEMGMDEKNRYSHRKKATEKFILFLNQLHAKNKD